MLPMSLSEINAAVGGRINGDKERIIRGVNTDSRTVERGELFVPLIGDKFNGHAFIRESVDKGAAAVFSSESVAELSVPVVQVRDTLQALQRLAAHYRNKFRLDVIAITGSHGKTTTKDMLAALLDSYKPTFKTPRNLNGQIGIPLALFNLTDEYEFMVAELGVSKPGEMKCLVDMTQPRHGLFLNVEYSHTEFFETRDAVFREKSILINSLPQNGKAFLNADDPFVSRLIGASSAESKTFALHSDAHYVAYDLKASSQGRYRFKIKKGAPAGSYEIPLLGKHNVSNALAAIAAASELGVNTEKIKLVLHQFKAPSMRMQAYTKNGILIVNDCYNAAPRSVREALTTVAEIPVQAKRIAVLGDMLELGPSAQRLHYQTGKLVSQLQFDYLCCFGELSDNIVKGAVADGMPPSRTFHSMSKQEIADKIRLNAGKGDLILFKGSRGMKMEDIILKVFFE